MVMKIGRNGVPTYTNIFTLTPEGCHMEITLGKRFLLCLLFAIGGIVSPGLAQSLPPNIVVILADDLGYGDVSYNGCPDYATPYIDSIANNAALCTDGYVTHPFCSPSRAALLTGRY